VVTKAALDALTLTLGVELAGRNIVTVAVDPGPTDPAGSRRTLATCSSATGCSVFHPRATSARRLAGEAGRGFNGPVVRAQQVRI
jgi:NAD(P)-dependent dehydrogenase (short-subunit alcohol dehydrogenase family)